MEEASRNTRIFISYSRKDKHFVCKLNDAIDAAGIEAGSPLTENFAKSKWKLVFFEGEYYPICPNLPAGGN